VAPKRFRAVAGAAFTEINDERITGPITMDAIEIKMGGQFYCADQDTLKFIAEHRKAITNGNVWPISYWVI